MGSSSAVEARAPLISIWRDREHAFSMAGRPRAPRACGRREDEEAAARLGEEAAGGPPGDQRGGAWCAWERAEDSVRPGAFRVDRGKGKARLAPMSLNIGGGGDEGRGRGKSLVDDVASEGDVKVRFLGSPGPPFLVSPVSPARMSKGLIGRLGFCPPRGEQRPWGPELPGLGGRRHRPRRSGRGLWGPCSSSFSPFERPAALRRVARPSSQEL